MTVKIFGRSLIVVAMFLLVPGITAQTVPMGMSYQAVARDNYGKELTNREIDVRFSVILGNPEGPVVYQELHSNVITSKYGVFSLVIGKGIYTTGTVTELTLIRWDEANHYLKVEIKFENDYMDMGTMQFLAVPYALYAQKSLEPGPQGPKGDTGAQGIQGNPATDDQSLSFDGTNLSISGGNTINMSTLNVPHQLTVTGNNLSIMGGNEVALPNEIQDLSLDAANKLTISKNPASTGVDLTKYLDDKQELSYNGTNRTLSITNGTATVDLSGLLNDADANPVNEIQTPTYNPDNFQLSLSSGGGSATIGQIIAFRAGITVSLNLLNNIPIDLIFDQVVGTNLYNDGSNYNAGSGVFQAPYSGVYTFEISMNLPYGSTSLVVKLNGANYETVVGPTSVAGYFRGSVTMRLNKNDIVNISIVQTLVPQLNPYIISGTFSGYRVY